MMGEVIDLSLDSQSSAGSTSALTLDISAVSYESGRRALQLAVDGDGSIEEIASLLEEEAEEHQKSSSLDPTDGSSSNETPISCDHHTALEVAASAGHIGAVERLLKAGADPNAPVHEKGISVLEAAAGQGHLLVVQKLLETGAHPDHSGRQSDTTPLIAAATGGHLEICEALLQSGANFCISIKCWDDLNLDLGTSSAIEAAAGTSSITLLELFLAAVEDLAKDFDQDELEAAMAEARQEDSKRLLETKELHWDARSSIDRALVKAASTGNMLILQRLLDAGADITAKPCYSGVGGPNAIAAAASRGHLEAMNKLLQTGSDQNNLPANAVTEALQSAVDSGNMALLEPLLQAGADATEINIRNAAVEGHLDTLTFILQSGAVVEVNKSQPREFELLTSLHLAAYHGHQDVVDLLLAKGADVDNWAVYPPDMQGATAIQLAVTGGHLAVVKQLIHAGADVKGPFPYSENRWSADTPLQAAVRADDMTMIELLLAAGAAVDVVRHDCSRDRYKTALSIAAEVNNPNIVARLISIMPLDVARRHAPLALQRAAENHNVDIAQQLLQLHPDLSPGTDSDYYYSQAILLPAAAANGNLEILEMLLAEGADVNYDPSRGLEQTALQVASEQGNLAAVELLLAAGAKVNATGSTAPPLLLAIRGGHVAVFEHLLAAGADIHATAYQGQTMLEAAEVSGNADIQGRVRAALDSQLPPQIDHPHGQGTGPLCETCRMAPWADIFRISRRFVLHPSLTALRVSAAAGCPLCCFLWKGLEITSMAVPQSSRVAIYGMKVWYLLLCRVVEPFPAKGETGESIAEDFPYCLPFEGEITLLTVLLLLKQWAHIGCRMPGADVEIDTNAPITEDTSSPETYRQIRTWLNACQNEHPKCQVLLENPSLPTRLIYLDTLRDTSLSNPVDTSLQPRLMSTTGRECSECRYIALSYRWPEDFPIEAKLTRDNICEQMRGLNTSKLPQVFKDLFQVAIRLDITYVWIDSLCIIQDDPEDWDREAALMFQTYRYAELTVAAAAPPTKPDTGLFRHGDPSDVLSVRLPDLRDPSNDAPGQEVVLLKPQKITYKESPLVSRGWCFQEREISRRVVHYTETQVLWECRTVQASEGLPSGIQISQRYYSDFKTRIFDEDLSGQKVDDAWYRAVEDYSTRHLTVFTDKLPALAGLAATIRDYKPANCRYLAGLWEDDFLNGLQWSSQTGRNVTFGYGRSITNTRYPEYVAPTWSWASVAGPISYDDRLNNLRKSKPTKFTLKVLDIYVQTSTSDPFGAVRHAILTCMAGLLPCVLSVNKDRTDHRSGDYEVRNADGVEVACMDFDVPQEKFDEEEVTVVFCICLGVIVDSYGGPALVVLPTGNKENEYRRVGMISNMDLFWFHDPEMKEIMLV